MKKLILFSILSLMIFCSCKEAELPEPENAINKCIIEYFQDFIIKHKINYSWFSYTYLIENKSNEYDEMLDISCDNISYNELDKFIETYCSDYIANFSSNAPNIQYYKYGYDLVTNVEIYDNRFTNNNSNFVTIFLIYLSEYPINDTYNNIKQNIRLKIQCGNHIHFKHKLK